MPPSPPSTSRTTRTSRKPDLPAAFRGAPAAEKEKPQAGPAPRRQSVKPLPSGAEKKAPSIKPKPLVVEKKQPLPPNSRVSQLPKANTKQSSTLPRSTAKSRDSGYAHSLSSDDDDKDVQIGELKAEIERLKLLGSTANFSSDEEELKKERDAWRRKFEDRDAEIKASVAQSTQAVDELKRALDRKNVALEDVKEEWSAAKDEVNETQKQCEITVSNIEILMKQKLASKDRKMSDMANRIIQENHKFKLLQSKTDADIAKLQKDNAELNVQIRDMQAQLDTLYADKSPSTSPTSESNDATALASEHVAALQTKVKTLKAQLEVATAKTEQLDATVEEVAALEDQGQGLHTEFARCVEESRCKDAVINALEDELEGCRGGKRELQQQRDNVDRLVERITAAPAKPAMVSAFAQTDAPPSPTTPASPPIHLTITLAPTDTPKLSLLQRMRLALPTTTTSATKLAIHGPPAAVASLHAALDRADADYAAKQSQLNDLHATIARLQRLGGQCGVPAHRALHDELSAERQKNAMQDCLLRANRQAVRGLEAQVKGLEGEIRGMVGGFGVGGEMGA